MKKSLICGFLLIGFAISGFSQGQVQIINFSATFRAKIYGPEGNDPLNTTALKGNGATDNPVGSTVFTGAALSGTGFSCQMWGGALGTLEGALVASSGTSGFRTGTSAGLNLGGNATIAAAAAGTTATLQMRAWDNRGGTVTMWQQVLDDNSILRGLSDLYTSPNLTAAPATPAIATGLRAFNIHPVPEPSLIALGALGLGALLLRRRKA